jgi:hypothetical protein
VKTDVRATSSAARKLTAAVRKSGLSSVESGLGFATPLRQGATSATGTCSVLDLVLGPLDLNLLGLKVHFVLGSLFCQLASATASVPPLPPAPTTP